MIRKIERADGVRWEVYGTKAPCSTACEHKECASGHKRKVYVGTYDSEKLAKKAEQTHKVTQQMIADGELPPEVDTKRTVEEGATDWLASLERRRSRSHSSYTKSINGYVLPTFRALPISRVTKTHVENWRDEMATRLAPATVNGAIACMQSAFNHFVTRKWTAKNPCEGVERIEQQDRDYLWIQTTEEINRLLLNVPGDIRDLVALMLGTGMRVDEVICLEHGDVDLEKRLITVQHGTKGTTKSGKVRRIPVLDVVLPMLRQRGLQRGGARLVFPGREGKRRAPAAVRAAFKRAAKRAGFPPGLRLYDCRHTFASHWVANGGDIFALSKVLGHHSVTVTEKFYAHLRPDRWERDYGRVTFHVPAEAPVYEWKRNDEGRVIDRVLRAVG